MDVNYSRFDLGFGKPAQSFSELNVKELVKGVCMHKIYICSSKIALDQVLEGLRSHEVNEMIEGDVSLAKSLFCSSEPKALDDSGIHKPGVSCKASNADRLHPVDGYGPFSG